MWESFAIYTGLNLGTWSQIWWANLSSASNRHHCRCNKVEKGHWQWSGEEKKGAELQTKHDKSQFGVQALEEKKNVLQFWRV